MCLAQLIADLNVAPWSIEELVASTELVHFDPAVPLLKKERAKTLNSLWVLAACTASDPLAAYEAFIAPQRKAKLELPEHAFKDFCARIRRVAPDQAHPGFTRLGAAVLLHDIGKTPWVHDLHQQVLGTSAPPGHDEAMAEVFAAAPSSFFSAVEAWPDPGQSEFLEVLAANFNLLQFVQGECPAASLAGIRDLSDAAYDLLVAEALLDLAGQAGLPPGAGSVVVNRATWEAVNPALQSLDGLRAGKYDVVGAWKNYYKRRGEKLGLDADNVIHFALIRVGCQLRWLTPAQGRELLMGFAEFSGYANREVFVGNLPACTSLSTCLWGPVARLVNCLNATGFVNDLAILPEYMPDLVQVVEKRSGVAAALDAEARVLDVAYTQSIRDGKATGVVKVVIDHLRDCAMEVDFRLVEIRLSGDGRVLKAHGRNRTADLIPTTLTRRFDESHDFGHKKGARIRIVAAGGGADPANARLYAEILGDLGVHVDRIVAVRRSKPSSQAPDGSSPTEIRLQGHRVLADGVYGVTEDTRRAEGAKFRFTELLAAGPLSGSTAAAPPEVVMVIDDGTDTLVERLAYCLNAPCSGAEGENTELDGIVVFDTGGDILGSAGLPAAELLQSRSQDHRTLAAVLAAAPNIPAQVAIAACGMDSPSDTKDKLVAVAAEWMPASDRTLQVVVRGINEQAGRYFHVERETFYGKSPLAWQLALNGKFGYHSLPIPPQYACHQQNPWQVYYWVDGSRDPDNPTCGGGSGIFVMDARKLLDVIAR